MAARIRSTVAKLNGENPPAPEPGPDGRNVFETPETIAKQEAIRKAEHDAAVAQYPHTRDINNERVK
ncbi:MAG: hypothetical protein ABSG21_09885 [Spirochaetia bacterium]|jgi:hypothetical protein